MFTPAKRPPSPTGYVDSRSRECGDGAPPCPRAPAHDPNNPLSLCPEHLAAHRARLGLAAPVECPACNPIAVMVRGVYVTVPGAMCFACGLANGGTVANEQHRRNARAKMIARLAVLLGEGDSGPEWVALLARCPADVRERAERRLRATVSPFETAAK